MYMIYYTNAANNEIGKLLEQSSKTEWHCHQNLYTQATYTVLGNIESKYEEIPLQGSVTLGSGLAIIKGKFRRITSLQCELFFRWVLPWTSQVNPLTL